MEDDAPEIDQATAAALGWPKTKYAWIERERRWLCRAVPFDRVVRTEALKDLYVEGTQLRLREALPMDGGPPMRRLGRKADVNPSVRLLTSIYLAPEEFRLLSSLPGKVLRKTRHYLGKITGADVSVDVFEGPLSGLIMAEAEFADAAAMDSYPMPDFAFARSRRTSGTPAASWWPTACRTIPWRRREAMTARPAGS